VSSTWFITSSFSDDISNVLSVQHLLLLFYNKQSIWLIEFTEQYIIDNSIIFILTNQHIRMLLIFDTLCSFFHLLFLISVIIFTVSELMIQSHNTLETHLLKFSKYISSLWLVNCIYPMAFESTVMILIKQRLQMQHWYCLQDRFWQLKYSTSN